MVFLLQGGQVVPRGQHKAVRVVSTWHQGRNPLWVSVEKESTTSSESGAGSAPEEDYSAFLLSSAAMGSSFSKINPRLFTPLAGSPSPSKCCVTLMPYTLVTPHFPPVCRPVLLLPTILGRVLDKKLASWQGFELCEPGKTLVFIARC